MDMEQFKMVLEAVQQLGIQGKEAFIWWLVFEKALPVIGWLLTLPCLMALIYWLIKSIRLSNEDTQRLQQLRDVLCPEDAGGYVRGSEFRKMMEEARSIK